MATEASRPVSGPWPQGDRTKTGATVLIIALIAAMMSGVLASFAHIAAQQARLEEVRSEARLMRMTRQAMTELDVQVLNVLVHSGEKPDLLEFGRVMSRLDGLGGAHLPAIVKRGANNASGGTVSASLKAAWSRIMEQASDGDLAGARETYALRSVEWEFKSVLAGFSAALDEKEARYREIQSTVDRWMLASFIGQILVGALSIAAFLVAARKGAREARARADAIVAADSTREQVLRLFEMTDMLQSATDISDANAVLTSTAVELLAGFGGALYVFNNSHDRLALSTRWGVGEEIEIAPSIAVSHCWALKRGKPHVNSPAPGRLRCEHHEGDRHALEAPMIARGEILGLLQIYADGDDAEARLQAALPVVTAVADAMSLALANLGLRDKLRSQALRDPLTNLYNRRYMEDTLQRIVKLADREKRDVSVIMIDLDHFKRLNDSYGHAKGDAVLRDVAALVLNNLRESDVACRYGGEELMIILPHCSLEMAAQKAERLRAGVEALSEQNGAQISASFGVASIPATSTGMSDLMAAADAALYQAKQAGRNKVVKAQTLAPAKDDRGSQTDLLAAE